MSSPYLPVLLAFELSGDPDHSYSEQEVVEMLSHRIAWLLEHRMEWLFSLLYRMDIDEHQVRRILHPESDIPAAEGLARLVFNRQKARQTTKKDTPVDEIDPDLAW
ncbi:MAG: hypothetical protein J5I41_11260 [Saprospiraceae bacterium]|nr:hypothetical protein [Saprospiraceae bacterium]